MPNEDEPDGLPPEPPETRTAIGWKAATILYLLLLAAAGLTLKGKPLLLALIIVGGLAAKSYLHYFRAKTGELPPSRR
ncbi:MAG: hypothetical protein M3Y72_18165 [Acidobacteriota bacterium]|nr:hypothetical protein [Acidobacteriota bacterium]